jgi:hypothetical protein
MNKAISIPSNKRDEEKRDGKHGSRNVVRVSSRVRGRVIDRIGTSSSNRSNDSYKKEVRERKEREQRRSRGHPPPPNHRNPNPIHIIVAWRVLRPPVIRLRKFPRFRVKAENVTYLVVY